MKTGLCSWIVVLLLLTGVFNPFWGSLDSPTPTPDDEGIMVPPAPLEPPQAAVDLLNGVGDAFIENLGQVGDPAIRFCTQGGRVSIGLTDDGIEVVIRGNGAAGEAPAHFAIRFDGCEIVRPVGRGAMERATNYFIGNDPTRWVRGARSFTEVVYEGLWEGVDLVLMLRGDALKYDFELATAADAGKIVFKYEGVEGLSVDDATGDLVVRTAAGELRDGRPVVFQDGILPERGAEGRFVLHGGSRIGFEVPKGCDSLKPVLIDPGLVFSTFLGGSEIDAIDSIALDDNGKIFVAGVTFSPDFSVTTGSYDTVINASSYDGFIARLNGEGYLEIATYIGGNGDEYLTSIVVGTDGGIFVASCTNSTNLPCTLDAVQASLSGGNDGAVIKFNPDLSDLLLCTYLGGSSNDSIQHMKMHGTNTLLMSGFTNSSDFPSTEGAYCRTFIGEENSTKSLIVISMAIVPLRILYSTFLNVNLHWGDPLIEIETNETSRLPINSLSIDEAGIVYLAGSSRGMSINTTPGVVGPSYHGGAADGFIIKLNPLGNGAEDLIGVTYFGGIGHEQVTSILLSKDGHIWLAGFTNSTDFPVTDDAICNASNGMDGFISRLDADLRTIEFSTHIGGSKFDLILQISMNINETMIYAMGTSGSDDLPCTMGCFDNRRGAALFTNTFLMTMSITEPKLLYCTYLGGRSGDTFSHYKSHVLYGDDLVYGFGTFSYDFPTTKGAFQRDYGGGILDGILLRFNLTACGLPAPPSNLTAVTNNRSATLRWDEHTNLGYRVLEYRVYMGESRTTMKLVKSMGDHVTSYTVPDLENGRTYYVGVSALNTAGEGEMNMTTVRPVGLPSVPRSFQARTGDGTLNISWAPPLDLGGGILGYHVLKGPTSTSLAWLATVNASTLTYHDFDVTCGDTYWYGVVAFNQAGNGTMLMGSGVPREPPGPPTDVNVSERDGSVYFSWQPPLYTGGNAIRGYRVYRGVSPVEMSRVVELESGTHGFADLNVRNGIWYCYQVTTLTDDFESARSSLIWGSPFGPPLKPLNLTARADDLMVRLNWSAPESDNGRPITGYVIQWGTAPVALVNKVEIGNMTYHIQAVPENGVEYFFQVAAINEAGPGQFSAEASAFFGSVPGTVQDLQVVLEEGDALLTWQPPLDTGGAKHLTYRIWRMGSNSTLQHLGDVLDGLEYMDNTTEVGASYIYRVQASNPSGSGPMQEVLLDVIYNPSLIDTLSLTVGDGLIELQWSPPASDGGSAIAAYFIYKRGPEGQTNLLTWTVMLNHTDNEVVPGSVYTYYIVARNARFNGTDWMEKSATALTHPGPVSNLELAIVEGAVELSWYPPTKQGAARTMGYVIYRGTEADELVALQEIGLINTYRDETVEDGNRYYYQVVAKSDIGNGDPSTIKEILVGEEPGSELGLWPFALALFVIVVLGVMVVLYRRRARTAEAGEPTVHIVEEVLVVLRDGRLIADSTRDEARGRDAEVMTGMLTAIQGFAKEGLERGGSLESIKYEDNTILMVSGARLYVAAVVFGQPDEGLRAVIEETVRQLEAAYGDIIDGWDGDLSVFAGMQDVIRPLVERTREVTRQDVQAAERAPGETDMTSSGD